MVKVLLVAGGTGGHIVPALAVAEELLRRGIQVEFLGTGKSLEVRLIERAGFVLHKLTAVPLVGKGFTGVIRFCMSFPALSIEARRLLKTIGPNYVLGFGGYPSVIPLLSAKCMGLPIGIHEQNQMVGLANRCLAPFARNIFAVRGARGFFIRCQQRSIQLPNPVRREFLSIPEWGSPGNSRKLCLTILGGSQGAQSLNTAILSSVKVFARLGLRVVHQTGEGDYERVVRAYTEANFHDVSVFPFVENIASVYEAADILIARAGAMTVAEIAASGRACIFVPLEIARAHQRENVRLLLQAGGARMLLQDKDLQENLEKNLVDLCEHPEKLQLLAGNARLFGAAGSKGKTAAEEIVDSIHYD